MTPQTRSAANPSPGRSTRNSIFGRPPPSPPKPRSRSPTKTSKLPFHSVPAPQPEVNSVHGTPWLACKDPQGIITSVTVSNTGEGTHIRWHHQEDVDMDKSNDKDNDVEMSVAGERGVTPITAGPVRRPFPRTPMPLHSYDAGSVIRTPVKKVKPLQRTPARIGDKGIRCLYQKPGVLSDLNGEAGIARHSVNSATNLSREQVERLEDEWVRKIIQNQTNILLADKERTERDEEQSISSGYGDETQTQTDSEDHRGEFPDLGCQSEHNGLRHRARFGPEGTELIDSDADNY